MEQAVSAREHVLRQEGGHEIGAEPTGEVVVATTGGAQGSGLGTLAQGTDRRNRRQVGQRFEELGYLWPGEAVVAVADVGLDR
jgi:hypothetical protein